MPGFCHAPDLQTHPKGAVAWKGEEPGADGCLWAQARLLLELSDEDDRLMVRERLTHQDIADRVGCQEMVSRILGDLVRGGYVSTEKAAS
jgi:hypothetical protein